MSYDIYLNGDWIDTVYFQEGFTAEEVRTSLIQHDNYHPNIEVEEAE